MAEPVNPSSPSKPLAGQPQTKRTAAAAAPPPPKRRHTPTDVTITHSPSTSNETLDTATSKPEEEDEEVEIDDDVVIHELSEYELRNGTNPVQDYYHMQRFCFPYIHMGIGNKGGWEAKIRHLKYKFKNKIVEMVAADQVEEFLLWKKMFARVVPDDAESRTS